MSMTTKMIPAYPFDYMMSDGLKQYILDQSPTMPADLKREARRTIKILCLIKGRLKKIKFTPYPFLERALMASNQLQLYIGWQPENQLSFGYDYFKQEIKPPKKLVILVNYYDRERWPNGVHH